MQLIEVTHRKDAADKKFIFSQSCFQTYFTYITNYADTEKPALTLPEWIAQFIPDDADKPSGLSIEEQKNRIIEEAERNAAMVMEAFMKQGQ